jgi:predicted metal-binding protein
MAPRESDVPKPERARLTVCSTCRLSKGARENAQGQTGGALFAGELAAALRDHACRDRLALRQTACFFACSEHCTAYVESDGRVGYLLGRFVPSQTDAVALLDYIAYYLDSADGTVPYALWPQGVKGHFIARIPASDTNKETP